MGQFLKLTSVSGAINHADPTNLRRVRETMEELRMLGLILSKDLSWNGNIYGMFKKAYKRLG